MPVIFYLAPSPFEASFLSLEHGREELDFTFSAYEEVLEKFRQ
ncbi:MAG: hypothetical protein ACOC5A_00475 [Halanaerobiales bacterium]